MKTYKRLVVGAGIVLMTLTACSAAPEQAPKPASTKEAETTAPVETEHEIPEACAAIDLALGAQLDGASLGECVSQALSSYGSGRMQLAGGSAGDVEFTYDPGFNAQGELQTPEGSMRFVFLGDEMWIDSGAGPVKGDPNSENIEEQIVAMTGEMTRFFADLSQTAQLIQAQPVWNVDGAMAQVTMKNGDPVEAYRIVSGGAFSWNDIAVTEFVLWFGEDWVPLSTQATVDFMGVSTTNSQLFYDLGEPITISPMS